MKPKVYVCKNRDEDIRWISTSGGMFTLFAQHVLEKRGVVYGVIFDENWRVRFARATSLKEIAAMRGSKYAQAYVGETFRDVQSDLKEGKPVLFTGTPCQVQGLRAFLRQDYEGLVCVDIVCLGIGSPGVWENYLEQYFGQEEIKGIRFKDKREGWHKFTTVIKTDKREVVTRGQRNPYLGSYLVSCNIRPCCYNCRFKGVQGHAGDLTISDSWGIDWIPPEFDDDKGLSNVFINTPKGATMFAAIQDRTENIAIDFEKAVQGNPYYAKSVEESPKRSLFWDVFYKKGLPKAFHDVAPRRRVKSWFRKIARPFQLLLRGKRL